MVEPSDSADAGDPRRPRGVYGVGSEPDPRFSMANERTALAWVRTGLALIAGGVALTSVAALSGLPALLDAVAVLSCVFGALTAVNGLVGWHRAERALRLRQPLPPPTALRWLVGFLVLTAIGLAWYAITQAPA